MTKQLMNRVCRSRRASGGLAVLGACWMALSPFVKAEESPTPKPDRAGMSAEKLAEIDKFAQKLIDAKATAGCVIAVMRRGELAYLKAFGKQQLDPPKPMRTDTIFRIYSMTKAITTAATLMLVEDQRLGLDDPVSKYLPEFKELRVWREDGPKRPEREMTVRDLMRHTSGLTYGFSGETAVDQQYREADILGGTLAELPEKLSRIPLLYEPGSRWVYSVSTDVLGRLIEKVSGETFPDFLEKRIFVPLEMRDTGFHVPADKIERFAVCYNTDGNGQSSVQDAVEGSTFLKPPRMASGGGGLVSTARDYLNFLRMIQSGGVFNGKRLLKPESVRLMTSNQLPESIPFISIGEDRPGVGFGLGFSVRTGASDWDPAAREGEYGWGGAASTHYWVSPKDDLIVVTMEQIMPFNFNLEFGIKKLIYEAIED